MNYFLQAINVIEIGEILRKLGDIKFEFRILEVQTKVLQKDIEDGQFQFLVERAIEKLPELAEKRKQLEDSFQKELIKLTDFNFIARNYTSELLDEISEVDPDAIEKEAINNSKTGRKNEFIRKNKLNNGRG